MARGTAGTAEFLPVAGVFFAAKAGATMGEIVDAMKAVFGEWQETPVL